MPFNIDRRGISPDRRNFSEFGFTMIELIMVMVLMGVMAVFAAPRIFNSGNFNARGFHDETLAFLRYAQKTAVAQRRTVCIVFAAPGPAAASLSIASVAASGICDRSLTGPNKNCPDALGGSSGCIHTRSGVSYSSSLDTLNFDGLGRPVGLVSALTIQIALNGVPIPKTVFVESETGYVHE